MAHGEERFCFFVFQENSSALCGCRAARGPLIYKPLCEVCAAADSTCSVGCYDGTLTVFLTDVVNEEARLW